jgi:large subunit ribosomal protein L29
VKAKEIRKMKYEELEKKLNELRLELAKERAQIKAGGSVKNPGKIKQIKRSIARILTIKKEKMKERKEK